MACSQKQAPVLVDYKDIISGDQQLEKYLPILQDRKIAVVANHASKLNDAHLVDTLLSHDINIVKIFCPEHGFRGDASAGEIVNSSIDDSTGIPIFSLYGKYKKPPKEELTGIDIVLFDLQDVGVRFYTYNSTLTYVMEACAEEGIHVIVLDRPNPNAFYVDGPVLEDAFKSFVGMHKIPIVHGMTSGEFALMINGEAWLKDNLRCELTVIELKKYKHHFIVKLPIRPSPNLPNWEAIFLYPSLCLFEGTIMSVGRGTDVPFQVYGHPDFLIGSFAFMPKPKPGASKPKYEGEMCYGQNLTGYAENYSKMPPEININWLIESHKILGSTHAFFTPYFEKLSGTDKLRRQIEGGISEEEIRESWEKDIAIFKEIRKKYLLYE
jgi:uncharacterized protein YbbC (DUF1343 family)